MKILMLSWEYPPKNVGGLCTHVYHLTHALSKLGHEVHVITCEEGTAPIEENDAGVIVHRVTPYKIETDDFTKWVMHLNFAMIEEGIRVMQKYGKFDIIHGHDWLVAYSAKVLKWSFKIPMVSTIHATEYGRNGGIKTPMQSYISSVEWMFTYESWKVVACSGYMRQQISDLFKTPWDKMWLIPNGVQTQEFEFEFDWLDFRRKYARDEEKIIFYVGRHVFEKGIHLLINSAPNIIKNYNNTKFIISGKGPMTDELIEKVAELNLEDKFAFVGYLDNDTRNKLYRVANIAVFPSIYEPFGIVALEAMAAGCPVVVSDTGGLSEIVEHNYNGLKAIVGNSESLGDNISKLLNDDALAVELKKNALATVQEKYTWEKVAKTTADMYLQIKEEANGSDWSNENVSHIINEEASLTITETKTAVKKAPASADEAKAAPKRTAARRKKFEGEDQPIEIIIPEETKAKKKTASEVKTKTAKTTSRRSVKVDVNSSEKIK